MSATERWSRETSFADTTSQPPGSVRKLVERAGVLLRDLEAYQRGRRIDGGGAIASARWKAAHGPPAPHSLKLPML